MLLLLTALHGTLDMRHRASIIGFSIFESKSSADNCRHNQVLYFPTSFSGTSCGVLFLFGATGVEGRFSASLAVFARMHVCAARAEITPSSDSRDPTCERRLGVVPRCRSYVPPSPDVKVHPRLEHSAL